MTTDTVGRLAVTWRPDTDPGPTERARLDRLTGALADGGLPDGLGSAPDRDVRVCVRRIALPRHRMRWDAPDDQLVSGWARVVEQAVADAVADGGPDVVRYRSRTQARQDLVTSLLRSDRDRTWAWQLLDLWPTEVPQDDAAVLRAVLLELGREEPVAVVGLLVAVTTAGLLPRFARTAGEELLVALVAEAWRAAGGRAGDVAGAHPAGGPEAVPGGTRDPASLPDAVSTAVVEMRSAVLRRSLIAQALSGVASPASAHGSRALWAAAVLEVEPALARRPLGAALVVDLAAPAAVRGQDGPVRDSGRPGADRTDEPAAEDGQVAMPTAPDPGAPAPEAVSGVPAADAHPAPLPAPGRVPSGSALHPAVDPARAVAGEPPTVAGPGMPPAARPATTGWGGLLFLLPLVAELGLPDRVAEDPSRFGSALRPVLHGLARRLIARAVPDVGPAEPDDPAVLAFAGLVPGADPPDPVPANLLEPEVDALVAALASRLGRPPASDAAGERALLVAVCRRRAVVEADPGWIDVRLELDEVSVEVRRAGLDLDPGHLPWLGCVVRFRYG
jgi:hypothetical protein